MATPTDLTPLRTARIAFRSARQALLTALDNVGTTAAALAVAQRTYASGRPELVAATTAANNAVAAATTARANEKASRTAVLTAISNWTTGVSVDADIGRLSTAVPIVLFPVRVETRFGTDTTGPVLRVRIYPDEIFANIHEPAVTRDEYNAAIQYYVARDAHEATEQELWRQITQQMAPERAAYVLRLLSPKFDGGTSGTGGSGMTSGGSVGPEFPTNIFFKPTDFSRPGEAVLPDRWIVRAISGTTSQDFVGAPIPEPLNVTPDPQVKPTSELLQIAGSNPPLYIDDELAWTVDFTRAQAVGMAVEIPLTAAQAAVGTGGFDRLLVFGIKSSLDQFETTTLLEELFDSHHYTRGLAFVPQGTPTNNTEDNPTPLPVDDPDGTVSYAIERGQNPPLANTSSVTVPTVSADATALARVLGVHTGLFSNVGGSTGQEQTQAQNMATLMWPTTFGYVVEQLMSPLFTAAQHDALRSYFLTNVRARGPAPSFRVGQVPYGVLPALSLASWKVRGTSAGEAFENSARTTFLALRDTWRSAALTGVATVTATSTDPLGDLFKVLALYPSGREFRVRHALGELTLLNLFNLLGIDYQGSADEAKAIVSDLLGRISLPSWLNALLSTLVYADQPALVSIPLVATPNALSETLTLPSSFFTDMAGATMAALLNETVMPDAGVPNTIFYKLVRQALLYASLRSAIAFAQANNASFAFVILELQLLLASTSPMPFASLLQTTLLPTGGVPLGDFTAVKNDPQVSAVRGALMGLINLPTAELDRLLSETLDLASHRLDAWLTAYATRRLLEMRTAQLQSSFAPIGNYLGGYAFVENVRPVARTTSTLIGYGTVETQAGNGGFVQTPSLTHAAAAAVLRNGNLSYRDEGANKYAFDVSSARARAAREVFEELRAGQPLGAVFGYLFERGVQSNYSASLGLPAYLFALRNYYPLVANKAGGTTTVPSTTVPAVAARNVVDGLALWKAYQANTIPFASAPDLPRPTIVVNGVTSPNPAYVALTTELAKLSDAVDGVADLNVAEGVMQLLRGNVTNAAGNLDALARGGRPPDPLMAVSQRGGTPTSHRVALVFSGASANTSTLPGWPQTATPRSTAEPLLDDWAGSILGDITTTKATVTLNPIDPTTGTTTSVTIALSSLGLRPLDLVAIARAPATPNGGSLLDRRIAAAAAASPLLDANHVLGAIAYTPASGSGSIPQLIEVARSVGAVLGDARPLASADLVAAVDGPDATTTTDTNNVDNLTPLITRATNAANAIETIAAALDSGTNPSANLVAAAAYVPDAFPAPGMSSAALSAAAAAISAELHRRATAADAAVAGSGSTAVEITTARLAQLRAVFGSDFMALPPIVPPNAPELDQSLGARATLLPGTDDGNAPARFLQQAAQVYDGLGRFRTVQIYMGALGRSPLRLDIAQLPFTPGAPWVGLPFSSTQVPAPNQQSLLLFSRGTVVPSAADNWQGIVLADWVEVIPNATEETGITFNYDNPGAEAPQAILVVPPSSTGTAWTQNDVWATLGETLDLAKIRGVDLELVGGMGQFLPAIYAPQNLQPGTTISTNWLTQLLNIF